MGYFVLSDYLFRRYVDRREVSECLKFVQVNCIPKGVSETEVTSYTAKALTQVTVKVIEKTIASFIENFLAKTMRF